MRRFLLSFLPEAMPFMSRASYPRELRAWSLLAVAIGAVEGGVVGVIVKNVFAGTVSDVVLNLAVGVVSGAPAFANVLSFFWATSSHGRPKIRVLMGLQAACSVSLILLAVAPTNHWGLALFVTGVIAARVAWSGVLTVRSAVWRANYPRHARANFTSRVVVFTSAIMAVTAIVIGFGMDFGGAAFRYVYPLAALAGLAGALIYRHVRVRRHRALLVAEQGFTASQPRGASSVLGILRVDADYRRYMLAIFIQGSGNLMITAPLIITINDHLALTSLHQMLVTSSIPLLAIPLAIGIWARLLDRNHVVSYRALHSWSFVLASLTLCLGAVLAVVPLLWLGSVFLGIGYAGGMLGWNLGHNDFAPPELVAHYMSVNVTLTGIRGFIAPMIGVGLYELLENVQPGGGPYSLLLPFFLATGGAVFFVILRRRMNLAPVS